MSSEAGVLQHAVKPCAETVRSEVVPMASSRVAIFRRRMLICILLLGSYCFAAAQTLITTVTAGSGPAAVAV